MPKRIQLRRTKGWRKPDGAVVVSRPSKWGNPRGTAQEYREFLTALVDGERFETNTTIRELQHMQRIAKNIEELRGKDLCCWCNLDKPCHADVLLELANRESQ